MLSAYVLEENDDNIFRLEDGFAGFQSSLKSGSVVGFKLCVLWLLVGSLLREIIVQTADET